MGVVRPSSLIESLMLFLGSSLFNLSRTFVSAVLILYLLTSGINLSTIGLAKSLQLAVSILITVPAGKFADKYGNKISVVLACLFGSLYFIVTPIRNHPYACGNYEWTFNSFLYWRI